MSWKEANKQNKNKKTIPKKDVKPFAVKHYRFFPCVWSASVKEGYVCYLGMRKHNSYIWTHELQSYRFKSVEEAQKFAENNKDTSFVPT